MLTEADTEGSLDKQLVFCTATLILSVPNNLLSADNNRDIIYSLHNTLAQCCFDAGPTSTTLAQHQNSIGLAYVFVGF